MLLGAVLGLPGVLILISTFKIVYIGWMFIYLLALPICTSFFSSATLNERKADSSLHLQGILSFLFVLEVPAAHPSLAC